MKKLVSLLLVLTMACTLLPGAAAEGPAVPGWAAEAYADLQDRGLLNRDYPQVDGDIDRGDFAGLLAAALRHCLSAHALEAVEPAEPNTFADASVYGNMAYAVSYGILEGSVEDGQRLGKLYDTLTREQAAKMVCSALDFCAQYGVALTPDGQGADYADGADIAPWAAEYARRIAAYRLMVGDAAGNFSPKATLNWPSAVVLLSRFLDAVEAGADLPGLPLASGLDWSGSAGFGAGDYSVSKPLTGYARGYYTIDNGDGTFSGLVVPQAERKYDYATGQFVDTDVSHFAVERYDAQGKVVSTQSLPMELPIFGAFFDSGEHFYLAFGQMNEERDDGKEVYRVVQYDRNWKRLGAVSLDGADSYAVEPYRSAIPRMAVSADGDTVALYASRTRYDGHQSNITLLMSTAPFRLRKAVGEQYPDNHVSHSFGQFVQFSGDEMVTVDHGDAYPRSFVLQEGSRKVDLLKIAGATGENVTHAIGSGFELSGTHALFLGCSDPQQGGQNQPWNVFLAAVKLGSSKVELTWLTHSDETIDCARLVKLDDDTLVALWGQGGDVHYVALDGKGRVQGGEQVVPGIPMPPTQPVVTGRTITWIGGLSFADPARPVQPAQFSIEI